MDAEPVTPLLARDFEANVLRAAEPLPEFLLALCAPIADELGVVPQRLAHARHAPG